MLNAATKVELIKKIASLPESLPDESDERSAELLLEMQRLLDEANDILNTLIEHEEQRARALRHGFAALSEPTFAKVWNNAEDSIYDAL
jgi:hypothetical protein